MVLYSRFEHRHRNNESPGVIAILLSRESLNRCSWQRFPANRVLLLAGGENAPRHVLSNHG
jgi:hypothetical protein